jgi:hypothetical protein
VQGLGFGITAAMGLGSSASGVGCEAGFGASGPGGGLMSKPVSVRDKIWGLRAWGSGLSVSGSGFRV